MIVDRIEPKDIASIDISDASLYQHFAYATNVTDSEHKQYRGARTLISRFVAAAATNGEILPLQAPAVNATYEQTFNAPYVVCDNATQDVSTEIDGMMNRSRAELDLSVELVPAGYDYFEAVPAKNLPNASRPIQMANLSDDDAAAYASNELWIYVPSFDATRDLSGARQRKYLNCQLFNASYTTIFTWKNGRQNLNVVNRTPVHRVDYPAEAVAGAQIQINMAYSAVMFALSKLLVGTIGFYRDLGPGKHAGPVYSKIDSNVAMGVMIGSKDYDSHFRQNHLLSFANSTTEFSDQRISDMELVSHRSLETLIAELSSNITLSFLSHRLLA